MNSKDPFIKKFKTRKNFYIYDANTNRILLVSPAMWDIVDRYWQKPKEDIISQLREKHTLRDLNEGYDRIHVLAEEHKLFSPSRPKSWIPFLTETQVTEKFKQEGIQQLTLEVTESCNMRCQYCAFSGGYELNRVHGKGQMSWEIAKSAVNFYINQNEAAELETDLSIGFYGGEPLLQFQLISDVVDYVKTISEKKVRHNFTTNGTLLSDEIIKFCVDNQVGLTISLDGPQQEHDRYRIMKNGEGSFDRVIRNLEKLRQFDPRYYAQKVRFNCVISPSTDLLALNQFFQNNPQLFHPNSLSVASVSEGNDTFLKNCRLHPNREENYEELYKMFCDAHIENEVYSNKLTFLTPIYEPELIRIHKRHIRAEPVDNENISPACFPGLRKLFVTVDGSFHICEKMNSRFKIGDISSGFDYHYITQIINDFATIMNHKKCLDCTSIRFCRNCFASLDGDGMLEKPSDEGCRSALRQMENSFITYCSVWEENENAWDYMDNIVVK